MIRLFYLLALFLLTAITTAVCAQTRNDLINIEGRNLSEKKESVQDAITTQLTSPVSKIVKTESSSANG